MSTSDIILPELSEGELDLCKSVFKKMDTDGSGAISIEELKRAMLAMGQNTTNEECAGLMAQVDHDGSNEIEFDEFTHVYRIMKFTEAHPSVKTSLHPSIKKLIHVFEARPFYSGKELRAADGGPTMWTTCKPFLNGAIAGSITMCILMPIDMVKVSIQSGVKGGPFAVAANIIKTDGLRAMYTGLDAGILRQATYTNARMGIYANISMAIKEANGGNPPPLWQKAMAGSVAGALGAVIGNPADLTLVRMQADRTLPIEQRRNYKSIGDAFVRIVREDGIMGLFRGAGPMAIRAMALNTGLFAANDQAKEMISAAGGNKEMAVLGGAFLAGAVASACSLPFDTIKTKLMRQRPLPDGSLPYKGLSDCARKILMAEGPLAFFKGLPTYTARVAPQVTLTLVFMDVLLKFQAKFGL